MTDAIIYLFAAAYMAFALGYLPYTIYCRIKNGNWFEDQSGKYCLKCGRSDCANAKWNQVSQTREIASAMPAIDGTHV